MSLEKDIEILGRSANFINFLGHIHAQREAEIKRLRGAGKDEIVGIAGRVDAFDEVLELAKYHETVARFDALNR